jgi:nucleotide-binding universal stress UspA family protein
LADATIRFTSSQTLGKNNKEFAVFRKILVPIDLTDKHRPALDVAAELALQSGGTVTLLHLIELIAGISMEEEKDFYQRLETAARNHLARQGNHLTRRKVTWKGEVLIGQRVPEIIRYAKETGVDLIVLTSPNIDPNNPAVGLGSLSYKISFFSPCPLLLVK